METIGATILKQLQTLSSRANTLLHRLMNDAVPTARALERDAHDAERTLSKTTRNIAREEQAWIAEADRAMEELVRSR